MLARMNHQIGPIFVLTRTLFARKEREYIWTRNMSRFQGKVVIVTGSSSGIGAGTAVLFAKEGAKVTITGRKKDGLAGTKKAMLEVGANEDHINVVVADVTDALGREEIVTSTIQKFGRLDILINNAGAGFENGSMKMDANTDLLEKTMKVNVSSVIELIQLSKPHLIKAKGEIINVSSITGLPVAHSSVPYYAMSKAALDQMMRSLAIDLIAEDVRVNNVNPGVVVTQFIQNMGVPDEMAQKMYDSFASNRAVLPCGKVGNPSDIANVIAFLADRSQSFYIVGQTIVADGGTSIVLAMSSANTTFAELLK
ncbi:hypothetical protein RB195_017200 [Necator americanus]|uniref:Oxidoreductase, short chain dehydrogenase/reductase family protein n=2 Tax=Necator americanus TaxID=51031 RepID=A0ABR1C451_NECAM